MNPRSMAQRRPNSGIGLTRNPEWKRGAFELVGTTPKRPHRRQPIGDYRYFFLLLLFLCTESVGWAQRAPVLSDIPDQVIDEDASVGPIPIRIADPDTPLTSLTFRRESSDPNLVPVANIVVSGSGTNRAIRVTPRPNAFGQTTITLSVSDGQLSATDTFKVLVRPVNDLPLISRVRDQTVARNATTGPLNFGVFDLETEPTQLKVTAVADNVTLVPASAITLGGAGTNRTVNISPASNQAGSTTVTLAVTDADGGKSTSSFLLTVSSNGVAPQITRQPAGVVLAEGEALSLSVVATGDAPLRYQWRFNGQPISGATSAEFIVAKVVRTGAGSFDVVVSNEFGSTTSSAASVEVNTYDFGDAPSPYPTLKPDGAAHRVQAGFGLGTPPDGEGDGLPEAAAKGDDNSGTSDENGVVLPLELTIGRANQVQVRFTDTFHATPSGILVVWLDLNANGSWDDAGERFGPFQLQNAGTNTISLAIPAGLVPGSSFARFRLTSDGAAQSPRGRREDPGEVEDHSMTLKNSGTGPGEGGATLDFGDAPDSYQTTLASDGARHTRVAGFNLGRLIDVETNAVPPLNGFGDNSSPAAANDEDGITFLSAVNPGFSLQLRAVTTITNGTGKLDAWVDWNQNGSFADVGDRIYTGVTVTNGTNTLPAVAVPANASVGSTFARFRLSRGGLNTWFGLAQDGEVEDYTLQVRRNTEVQLDFGDAPQGPNGGYPTTLARNGARHQLNQSIHLGQLIDLEPDGQPNVTASGDDTSGAADEDGVFFPSPLVPGATNVVQVEVVSPPGMIVHLDAFIDFNRDGDWADAGEKVFNALPLANGSHTLAFAVPATASAGLTFARFRLSQQGGLSFDGDGGVGEVEDLRLTIEKAQETGTCDLSCQGTDFWVAFPGNYAPDPANPVTPVLAVVGPINSVITVENLAVATTTRFTNVTGTLRISLNKATDLGDLNDAVARKGVHVTVTQPSTLYGLSKVTYTSDGYLALPSETLGTEHVMAAFGNVHAGIPELNGTQFAMVATETNTTVTVIPSITTGARTARMPYSIVLTNRGDCYQLRNTGDAPSDLTGTVLLSDKPIAAYAGHHIANVASADPFFADYLVESMPPVNRWGSEFYTTPLTTRSGGDTYRIVAARDNTAVTLNSAAPILLNRGDYHQTLLTGASRIVADKPVFVAQFAHSSDVDGVTNSDPFMVTVPARPHWSAVQSFTTPGVGFASHYVNVVVSKSASASLRMDGAPFASFSSAIQGGDYVFATSSVTTGTHAITCNEPVGVIVYGWNEYESYGWPGCLFFGDTTPPILHCRTNEVVVTAGRDSDKEPCRARVGDYRQLVQATDNCELPDQVVVEQVPAPGTFLPVGQHQIKLSVTDKAGNVGTCYLGFTVDDPNPDGPLSLDCPADMLVRCTDAEGAIVKYAVTALRGCTPLTEGLVCEPPPGTHFPRGTNLVTCTLTAPGQQPLRCSFRVIVSCRPAVNRTVKINPPTADPSVPNGGKQVVIEFEPDSNIVLEVADSVIGPWTELPNIPSRYQIKIAQERGKFFRLKEKTSVP